MSKQILDDMSYEVMRFLETEEVISKCLPLSKQWYNVGVSRNNFTLAITQGSGFQQFVRSLPDVSDDKAQQCVETPYYHKIVELDLSSPVVTDQPNDMCKIINNLVNLETLNIECYTLDEDSCLKLLSVICKSKSLKSLKLFNFKFTVECAKTLAESSLANQLETLVLRFSNLKDEGIQILCDSMKKLTELGVSGSVLSYESGLKAITLSPNMQSLKSLDISSILGIDHYIMQLLTPSLSNLTSLTLDSLKVGVWGCEQLLESFKNLTSLSVRDCRVGGIGIKHLSEIKTLTELSCQNNDLGVEDAKYIGTMTQLTFLNITNNDVGAEGAQHISKLVNLKTLIISANSIGPKGAQHIGEMINLTNLQISINAIGNEGAKALSKLTKLKKLNCFSNEISTEGALAIANNLINLESIQLDPNPEIGDEGAKAIVDLPFLKEATLSRDNVSEQVQKYCLEKCPRVLMSAQDDWDCELDE